MIIKKEGITITEMTLLFFKLVNLIKMIKNLNLIKIGFSLQWTNQYIGQFIFIKILLTILLN